MLFRKKIPHMIKMMKNFDENVMHKSFCMKNVMYNNLMIPLNTSHSNDSIYFSKCNHNCLLTLITIKHFASTL